MRHSPGKRLIGGHLRAVLVGAAALMALTTTGGVAPVAAETVAYEIDPAHSRPEFKVRHFFTKVPGRFTDFTGTIHLHEENLTKSSVELTIQAGSISTDNEKRDNHLRSGDFFDVENHPTITFTSTKVEKDSAEGMYKVTGDLTMRGVTKPVVLEVEFLGVGPDAWGGRRAGFEARTTVNRTEFGIIWNKTLDTGGVMLGEDVEIAIPITAIRASS